MIIIGQSIHTRRDNLLLFFYYFEFSLFWRKSYCWCWHRWKLTAWITILAGITFQRILLSFSLKDWLVSQISSVLVQFAPIGTPFSWQTTATNKFHGWYCHERSVKTLSTSSSWKEGSRFCPRMASDSRPGF